MSSRFLVSRLLRPHLRVNHARKASVLSHAKLLSTLPDIPIFRALQNNDPSSLVVTHSVSSRSFTYGNLVADVLHAKEELERKASKPLGKLNGERVAFLAENSYDYVGTVASFIFSFHVLLPDLETHTIDSNFIGDFCE